MLMLTLFLLYGNILCEQFHRITNGTNTDISKVPFTVAILIDGKHRYGGAIIAPKFALGVSRSFDYGNYSIRYQSSYSDQDGHVFEVVEVIKHPHFNQATFEHDLTIFKITDEQVFGEKSFAIVPDHDLQPGQKLLICGYGAREVASHHLETANVTIRDPDFCAKESLFKKDIMICSGGDGEACLNAEDSGNPLIELPNTLHGIASFMGRGSTSIFSRVFLAKDWIKRITHESETTTTFEPTTENDEREISGAVNLNSKNVLIQILYLTLNILLQIVLNY